MRAEDRSRRCLLLLLPASGLLRRLLRRCLRLSLLRHCCPPSLSGWRHRCSAVANRSALPSDYYSRKKITVTPLNFVCKCRAPALVPLRRTVTRETRSAKISGAVPAQREIRSIEEMPMKYRFLLHLAAQCLHQRSAHHAPIARDFAVGLTPQQRIHHLEKILRGRAFAGALAASLGRKRANRCRPIRFSRLLSTPSDGMHRRFSREFSCCETIARHFSARERAASVALSFRSASSTDR